jgi:hypothetical protein
VTVTGPLVVESVVLPLDFVDGKRG